MSTLKLQAIPVSLLLLAACGDSGGGSTGDTTEAGTGDTGDTGEPTTGGIDGDPALYQACLDYFAVSHARPSLECECKVANGEFPTVDACVEATGLKFGDEVTCFCEAVALVPESAGVLDCAAEPGAQYIACLEPVACDDVPAQDACQDARFAATKDCPIELPNLAHDISDVRCNGEPGFTCADGLPIPDYKKCDGQPDCNDLSDEQGCP